jgi:phosphoglycolate phosphatase
MVGNGVATLIKRAVPTGTSEEDTARALDFFRKHYMKHSEDTTRPYDGILELLSSLKAKGKRIAVVSNKFDAATKALCNKYFPNLIDIALGENEAEGIRKKPAPDMVFKAMKQLNASPKECVYIGDSDVDLQTAKNSGIPCISVLWGFRTKEFLQAHGATMFVEKPNEIALIS